MVNSIAGLIYIILGFIIAGNNGYFSDISTVGHILSAILAIALWPLVLLGVNLHLALLVQPF